MLLVEPYDLGDELTDHLEKNLPRDRYKMLLVTRPVSTAQDLRSLLDSEAPWDLLDIDAQGAEHGLLSLGNAGWLADRVRRLHVSTHTRKIHKDIRKWLKDAGWTILVDSGSLGDDLYYIQNNFWRFFG